MKIDDETIVSLKMLAKMIGLSERQIQRLVKEGVILVGSVQGYLNYVEDKSNTDVDLKEEKIKQEIKRLKKDTELKDLKIKETKNQLHLASIVEKVMTDMLMNIKGKLLSISSKVAPAVIAADNLGEIQDVIQDEIFEVLEELSEYDPEMFKNNKRRGNKYD